MTRIRGVAWQKGMTRADGIVFAKALDDAHPGDRQFIKDLAVYTWQQTYYYDDPPNQDELDYYQAIIDHLTGREKKT